MRELGVRYRKVTALIFGESYFENYIKIKFVKGSITRLSFLPFVLINKSFDFAFTFRSSLFYNFTGSNIIGWTIKVEKVGDSYKESRKTASISLKL